MKLDRIPLVTTRPPTRTATLIVQGATVLVEDGATIDPSTLGRVVAFLTTPRSREVVGELGPDRVDGVAWAKAAPVSSAADLGAALTELAGAFGVAPVWSELAEDEDYPGEAP